MKQLSLVNALIMAASISGFSQSGVGTTTRFAISPDNIQIAYEVHGTGEPALVFVHGWSCDRSYWKNQLASFSEKYTVVAVDLAGHGESGIGRKGWTIESFGADVASVVKKLGIKKVILIGHSMGGDVIAEAARQLPGQVVGLIMVDTYKKLGPGRSPEEVQSFQKRFGSNFKDSVHAFVRSMFLPTSDSALVEYVANDMSSAPPDIALPELASAMNYSRQMPRSLEELKLRVIAINPDNAPTDMASMERYGVEVMIMHGVGHFVMMENPPDFNRLLMMAINKLVQ